MWVSSGFPEPGSLSHVEGLSDVWLTQTKRPFIQRSNSRYGEYTNTRWILTQITVLQASKICAKIFTQVYFNMKCLGIFWQRSYHDVRWGGWKRNLKINNNLLAPHTKHKATDSSPKEMTHRIGLSCHKVISCKCSYDPCMIFLARDKFILTTGQVIKLPTQTIPYWGKSFKITRHLHIWSRGVCSVFHQKPHQSCLTETWAIKADGPHVDARQHQPGVKLKTSQWQVGHVGLIAFGAFECYQPLDCRQTKNCSNFVSKAKEKKIERNSLGFVPQNYDSQEFWLIHNMMPTKRANPHKHCLEIDRLDHLFMHDFCTTLNWKTMVEVCLTNFR